MKLGKLPAAPRPTDFSWSKLAASVALPAVPSRFGHASLFHGDWGMYGNDDYGDCVFAGAAHEHRMFGKVVHRTDYPFTDKAVLSDYSAVTGFVASDPSTDQGTDVHTALAYRRKTGIVDGAGNRHKIGAYVALDPKDWEHLRQAVYIFGAVGLGFEFPKTAMGQFNHGQPWDAVVPDGGIDGGHYVPALGGATSQSISVITWGARQVMTRTFYEKYNDEAWAYITHEALNRTSLGLHGFDIATLNLYLAALAS